MACGAARCGTRWCREWFPRSGNPNCRPSPGCTRKARRTSPVERLTRRSRLGEGEAPAEPKAAGSAGASPSQRSRWEARMRITEVECQLLHVPMARPRASPTEAGAGRLNHVVTLLVELATDAGLRGLGFAYALQGSG